MSCCEGLAMLTMRFSTAFFTPSITPTSDRRADRSSRSVDALICMTPRRSHAHLQFSPSRPTTCLRPETPTHLVLEELHELVVALVEALEDELAHVLRREHQLGQQGVVGVLCAVSCMAVEAESCQAL